MSVQTKKKAKSKVGRRGAALIDDDDNQPTSTPAPATGFDQYVIKWDKSVVRWSCEFNGFEFYGDWRQSRIDSPGQESQLAYAIDLRARIKSSGHLITMDSIGYASDPRKDMASLNRDICAALSKWRADNHDPSAESVAELRRKAETPMINVRRIETLDAMITALDSLRTKACRNGGMQITELPRDNQDDPSVRIKIEITTQAIALKGKVPQLGIVGEAGKRVAAGATSGPVTGDAATLIARLKASTNKAEKRKIRAQLRKMGVKGGARGTRLSIEPEHPSSDNDDADDNDDEPEEQQEDVDNDDDSEDEDSEE